MMKNSILTINSGASSIKFSLYETGTSLTQLFYGELESTDSRETNLHFTQTTTQQKNCIRMKAVDRDTAVNFLISWLEEQHGFNSVKAIGHRVAQEMKYRNPELITPALLNELKKTGSCDCEHLPQEIYLMELFGKRYPALVHIACFDNLFPASIQTAANRQHNISLYNATVLQRYGFHGFSFEYLLEELHRVAGSKAAQGKVILAHLDSSKSLAAFNYGKSIDISPDFKLPPISIVDTRSTSFSLAQAEKIAAEKCSPINKNFVVPVISEIESEVAGAPSVQSAKQLNEEDIEAFCYETRKWIGSFAASMGGLDTLVFTGRMGEHAPDVRSQVCDSLGFLGIELDEIKNMNNESVVSAKQSTVTVRIIKTNEELMIAKLVSALLNFD